MLLLLKLDFGVIFFETTHLEDLTLTFGTPGRVPYSLGTSLICALTPSILEHILEYHSSASRCASR